MPLLLFLLLALAACRRTDAPRTSAEQQTSVINVTSATPSSLTIRDGTPNELRIRGSGFGEADNTVMLGPITLTNVKSTENGTLLIVRVPDRVPSGGGAAPMAWTTGSYQLTIVTPRGRSEPITITVKEPT
jgi:hypothetical protein